MTSLKCHSISDLGIISDEPMLGAELDLALLAGLVSLVFLGPGSVSVDQRWHGAGRSRVNERPN